MLYEMVCRNEECDFDSEEYLWSVSTYEKNKQNTECPKCGTFMVPKIFSNDFILKGNCWERDGYK